LTIENLAKIPEFKIELAHPNNSSARSGKRKISLIILHWTGAETTDSTVSWFKNPEAKSSAHAVIAKDGTIIQMVDTNRKAWHAGNASWKGDPNVNDMSLGIEIVGTSAKFTDAQFSSCAFLCALLCKEFNIKESDIVGHSMVAPGRKIDIIGFDWDRFHKLLRASLGSFASPELVNLDRYSKTPLTELNDKTMGRTAGKDPSVLSKIAAFFKAFGSKKA
jgi:N-acetylmuramoyl-L-alanine amidase